METSPPVRDVAERDRANRNKFILVAVTSVLVLVAIVLAVGYFTHFASSELTAEDANSVIDSALSRLTSGNGSLEFCGTHQLIIKDNDTVLLVERAGNCTDLPSLVPTSLVESASNETEPKPDILCKVVANVHIAKQNKTTPTSGCDYSTRLEVRFLFNEKNQVQNITIGVEDPASRGLRLTDAIAETIAAALSPELIYTTYSYGTSDLNVNRNETDTKPACNGIPAAC